MLPSEGPVESRFRRQAAAEAARLCERLRTPDPLAIARRLGVEVRRLPPRSPADSRAGIRSEYQTDPPTILIYADADAAAGVAHELFHHGQCHGLLSPALCALGGREAEACARAFARALTERSGPGDGD